ncbi:MAG TPA: uroporphyrinogen decarboxylase [Candidatus Paceibacterota bacterium]|nr:uroporphyrinogen decarboxylase [Candidatus Paceibacterota bacterium]
MNDNFLKACRSERVERIPVWFMRQAGRSLPGYRKLREKYDMLTLAQTPELAARVSIEPIELLGVDAAIIFADIMLLPIAMGVDVKIVDSIGPVIDDPIKAVADIARLKPFEAGDVDYLQQTIKILRTELKVPLIGFSGAPFTLASYLIEGKPSRTWTKTKCFMFEEPQAWNRLMETLSDAIVRYLIVQIDAGAEAVQLFDSWVGCLAPGDYRQYVLPHMQRIFKALASKKVPRIHFGTDTGAMLSDFSNVDCEVIGVDWRIDISEARRIVQSKALQGNLDPAVLLANHRIIERKVDEILGVLDPHVGYIFNLGHGILPGTDARKVKMLVEYIHSK